MQRRPIVSVIMPTKNRAKFLPKTINSILQQTYNEWELIIIDDHSTDNTKKLIESYIKKDGRLKYYNLTTTTGPSAGRDTGIRHADTEYIVLADSDDLNKPDRLSETVKSFNMGYDVIYSDIEVYDIDTKKKFIRPSHTFNFPLLKCINYIPNPSAAFRKKLYISTSGYNHELKTSEDYDLWLRFAENNAKFHYINKPLVKMQTHSENITKTIQYIQRRKNLASVRKMHNLLVPSYNSTKKLIKNKQLLEIFSTEHQKEFWFTS